MARKRKSFPLRIDPDVHTAIKRWAADELRSTNGQIEFLLRRAVMDADRLAKPTIESPASDDAAPADPEE